MSEQPHKIAAGKAGNRLLKGARVIAIGDPAGDVSFCPDNKSTWAAEFKRSTMAEDVVTGEPLEAWSDGTVWRAGMRPAFLPIAPKPVLLTETKRIICSGRAAEAIKRGQTVVQQFEQDSTPFFEMSRDAVYTGFGVTHFVATEDLNEDEWLTAWSDGKLIRQAIPPSADKISIKGDQFTRVVGVKSETLEGPDSPIKEIVVINGVTYHVDPEVRELIDNLQKQANPIHSVNPEPIQPQEKVERHGRFCGKLPALGAPYERGVAYLLSESAKYGRTMTEERAKEIVAAWREKHPEYADQWLKQEAKPSGAGSALKFDGAKPPMDLLDRHALEEIARVLDFGQKKYAAHNWRKGFLWSRLIAAALRHLMAFNDGEDKDPESGLSHVAHAGCMVMFLLWMEKYRDDLDDRFKPDQKELPLDFGAFIEPDEDVPQ